MRSSWEALHADHTLQSPARFIAIKKHIYQKVGQLWGSKLLRQDMLLPANSKPANGSLWFGPKLCRCENVPSQKQQNLNTETTDCSLIGGVWLSEGGEVTSQGRDLPHLPLANWTIQNLVLNVAAITSIDCEWNQVQPSCSLQCCRWGDA